MKYNDFECVFSRERLRKYVLACKNNKRKALNLLIMSLFTLDHIHIPNYCQKCLLEHGCKLVIKDCFVVLIILMRLQKKLKKFQKTNCIFKKFCSFASEFPVVPE